MIFTVTYRAKDGALREERIEAADRAGCVAECRKRGIAPAGIKEGGGRDGARPSRERRVRDNAPYHGANGQDASSPSQRAGRPLSQWIVAVLIAAVTAGGVWWWMGGRGVARPSQGAANGDSKRTTASEARRVGDNAPYRGRDGARPSQKPPAQAPAQKPATNAAPEFVKRPGALRLPDGKVLTFPAPKEGEIRKVYAYGHMYECDHDGNFRDVTRRQLFKTAFEANFLGLAVADKPFIPAFLKGLDNADVQKILLKNYEAKGDETEEEMAQLKAYDDMRCAALQFMEEGGTFDDFVDYFARQVKEERETNAMCLREVMTLYKQGRYQEAKEMAEASEALKKQKGMKGLKLPPHVREKLGI